jgi:hypothetical protein
VAAGSYGHRKCVTSLSFLNVPPSRIEILEQNTVLRRGSVWYNQCSDQTTGWTIWDSNPGRGKSFLIFLFSKSSRPALGTTQHSVHSVLEFFLGTKQPGLYVYHSLASAKVKNEWRYTSAFLIRLRGLDGGTFTSTSCTILSN